MPSKLSGEIWGVMGYFNPLSYRNKLDTLRKAVASARRQGLKMLVVEAILPGNESPLADHEAEVVLRLPAGSTLWQKERLLNIGIKALPVSCDKIIWMDADIVFLDDEWVAATADLLNRYVVVQPFTSAHWLSSSTSRANVSDFRQIPDSKIDQVSYGTAFAECVESSMHSVKGHPGFAWAIRRSALQNCGLYDRLVLGGADTIIAAAMYGLSCIDMLKAYWTTRQCVHINSWMMSFHGAVRGSVHYHPGKLYHLWHGTIVGRRYEDRHDILRENDFDPIADLRADFNGCFQWSSDKPRLHEDVRRYFEERREDG